MPAAAEQGAGLGARAGGLSCFYDSAKESALKRSTDRILTTHPGRLPNPDNYAEIMQAGLIPVAYAKGTDFKRAPREPLSAMVHWETW